MALDPRKQLWSVSVLFEGAAALLVWPMMGADAMSPQRTLADAVRWGQKLSGGVPTGLVRGSAEPFRRAVDGVPHTYDTVYPLLGVGPPGDDGRWRRVLVSERVEGTDLVDTVTAAAKEHGCAGWVPSRLLGNTTAGGHGMRGGSAGDARRVCEVCFLEKSADRFDGELGVCQDCA